MTTTEWSPSSILVSVARCNGDLMGGRPRGARERRALLDLDGPGRGRPHVTPLPAVGETVRSTSAQAPASRRASTFGQPELRPHHRQQRVEVGARRRDRRSSRPG